MLKSPQFLPRENPDLDSIQYPIFVSPKLDGIRCLGTQQGPLSRTLKQIPNKFIQREFNECLSSTIPLDGELIIGSPFASDVYRNTNSVVMSHDKKVDFKFFVFDLWDSNSPFEQKYQRLKYLEDSHSLPIWATVVPHFIAHSRREVEDYESSLLNQGYEGLILRNPSGIYKQGRCTLKEANAFKLKRFVDSEAIVIDVLEEMANQNTKETNELGRTKRSTKKAGLVGKGTMGALVVSDPEFKDHFSIGSGFTAKERMEEWKPGDIVKYKYFPIGIKDVPRHPIYLGRRSKLDM